MSRGPGSPWTGWVSLWAGEWPGGCWGERGLAERDQPSPDRGSKQGRAREEITELGLGRSCSFSSLYFLRGHRERPHMQPGWPFYLSKC